MKAATYTDTSKQTIENRIEAPSSDWLDECYQGRWEEIIDTSVQPQNRTLTKLEYLRRFTQQERVGIRTAAKSEPVLEDYLALLDLAQEVNLDDQDTVAAVTLLELSGLIAPGRAAEILA